MHISPHQRATMWLETRDDPAVVLAEMALDGRVLEQLQAGSELDARADVTLQYLGETVQMLKDGAHFTNDHIEVWLQGTELEPTAKNYEEWLEGAHPGSPVKRIVLLGSNPVVVTEAAAGEQLDFESRGAALRAV